MRKFLLLFITGLLFCQYVAAQKSDTLVYYLKDNGEVVADRTSADYTIAVLPPDSTDENLFNVKQYFPNGNIKLIAKSTVNTLPLHFQGQCIGYYNNNRKQYTAIYYNGGLFGDVEYYYPNGKLYNVQNYATVSRNTKPTLVECRDSTGKVLCSDGKGQWLAFSTNFKDKFSGEVLNGLANGTWGGNQGDSITFTCIFKKGVVKSGIGYDKSGKPHPFKYILQDPVFGHGTDIFRDFINRTEHYPEYAHQHNLHEVVEVSFIVQRDGTVTDVKVFNGHIPCLKEEAVRIVSISPAWSPGKIYGIIEPVTMYINVYL